jgi:hypothetical protein
VSTELMAMVTSLMEIVHGLGRHCTLCDDEVSVYASQRLCSTHLQQSERFPVKRGLRVRYVPGHDIAYTRYKCDLCARGCFIQPLQSCGDLVFEDFGRSLRHSAHLDLGMLRIDERSELDLLADPIIS